jgi:hypothetical protein
VHDYHSRWAADGTVNRIHNTLRDQVRAGEGRQPQPSAAIVDSQSVRAAETVGRASRGYDAGKPSIGQPVDRPTPSWLSLSRLTAFDIADEGGLSNRRVWADHTGDGMCMDAEGAIWCQRFDENGGTVDRVAEGGEVLQRIELDLPCFACTLGGEDGRTLFMLVSEWRLDEGFEENIHRLNTGPRTGKVLTAAAPAPRAGWP